MKKFLKSLLIAIMLVPLSLSLVACGGDQLSTSADVDTKGTYTEAKLEDIKNFEVKESNAFDSGAKMSLSIKSRDNTEENVWAQADINAVVRWTKKAPTKEGEVTEYTFDQFALRTKITANGTMVTSDLYYKDGTKYTNLTYGENVLKYKKQVELETIESIKYFSLVKSVSGYESFSESIKSFESSVSDSVSVKVEKATSGKYTKWHLIQTTEWGETKYDSEVYYVFKSNKLVGFSLSINNPYMQITGSVESFKKEVDLPKDAEDYPTTVPVLDILANLSSADFGELIEMFK